MLDSGAFCPFFFFNSHLHAVLTIERGGDGDDDLMIMIFD